MKILVDTSVWSLALRRKATHLSPQEKRLQQELADLIADDRVVMIGPVRQELLSGISDPVTFETLRKRLRDFDDESLGTEDYESAAQAGNTCRASGIMGSAVDFLICAVAQLRNHAVFTTDSDFTRYARVLKVKIHAIGTRAV